MDRMKEIDDVLRLLGEDPDRCAETPTTRRFLRDRVDVEIFLEGELAACVATVCELGDLDGAYAALQKLAPAHGAEVYEADNYLRVKTTSAGSTLRAMIEAALARAREPDVRSIKTNFGA